MASIPELLAFNDRVYDGSAYLPSGWERIDLPPNITDASNGFHGEAYRNPLTNEIVIAFRGTDDLKDASGADLQMAIGKIPGQYANAIDLYDAIKETYNDSEITITGHSLGGALAQLVGAKKDEDTVTFNGFGVANLMDEFGLSTSADYSFINN